MIMIETEYERGDIVYLKTDRDQLPRIVFGYEITGKTGEILYKLACGINISAHYAFEISLEKDVLITTQN